MSTGEQAGVWMVLPPHQVERFHQRKAFINNYVQAEIRLDFVDYVFYLDAPAEQVTTQQAFARSYSGLQYE